jgi:hypothetical protein
MSILLSQSRRTAVAPEAPMHIWLQLQLLPISIPMQIYHSCVVCIEVCNLHTWFIFVFSLQMCSALLFDFCGSAFSLRPLVLCLYVHHGRLMWTCVFNVWKALFLARGQHCQVFNSGDNVRLEASQISPLCNDVVLQHVWVALRMEWFLISDGSPTHSVSELDYQSSCCLFHMAECGLEFRSQRNGNSCHTVPIHHASSNLKCLEFFCQHFSANLELFSESSSIHQ